jgi:hypothetical protein
MNGDPDAGAYMRTVMPSQVVQTIDALFSHAAAGGGAGHLQASHSPQLTGIINLAKAIPAELISVSASEYAELVLAISTIEYHLRVWISRGPAGSMSPVNGSDAISVVRRVLAKCRDEYPPPTTTELLFISDDELRESIRRDLGAAHRAFANSEWKAATVLAGAAVEALLLWKLQEPPLTAATVSAAAKTLAAGASRRAPKTDLNDWGLDEYITMAEHFSLLKGDTPATARLAQAFRNLIHPGRAIRKQQTCDRATALSALAALDHVIRDFT